MLKQHKSTQCQHEDERQTLSKSLEQATNDLVDTEVANEALIDNLFSLQAANAQLRG